MSKLLVVVGATGQQGGSVVSWFQANEPSWQLRGITRDPSSEKSVTLANSGVEIVKADLFDLNALKAAFKGATYIFGVTDFAALIPDATAKLQAGEIPGPVGAETYRLETQQGRNIADAAAGVPGLERLVWSSAPNVIKGSKGKYTMVFHFDAKAAVTEYMLSLDALKGRVSTLQLGVFTNNMFKIPHLWGVQMQPDKTAVWSPPLGKDVLLPWVDVEKDCGGCVAALIDAPAPIHVLCVSEWLTGGQFFELWSSHTGVPGRYEASTEIHSHEDPTGLSNHFSQTMKYIEDFGYTCGDPVVLMPEDLVSRGFPVTQTKLSDYMARTDWSQLIG